MRPRQQRPRHFEGSPYKTPNAFVANAVRGKAYGDENVQSNSTFVMFSKFRVLAQSCAADTSSTSFLAATHSAKACRQTRAQTTMLT
eukprot:scaffold921_cov397-Prasinococcus_capsulatus_cf.AAC.8